MSDQEELRNRVARLESRYEHVVMPKLEEQAEEIEAKDERIAELEATVDSLESRLESVIDVDDKADSTPTNRAVALREALVRAASDRLNGSGVKWWWKEVEEHLATHGHGGFSKPTYHKAMADAADKDGFTETTKEVISGGQRREVKAIQVDASEVTDPHLRNQLTTRDAGSASSETATAED